MRGSRVVGGLGVATFDELMQQLDRLERVKGISPMDILRLPPDLQPALRSMCKTPMPLRQLADELQLPEAEARAVADKLVDKGYLTQEERAGVSGPCYRVYFRRKHAHHIPAEL